MSDKPVDSTNLDDEGISGQFQQPTPQPRQAFPPQQPVSQADQSLQSDQSQAATKPQQTVSPAQSSSFQSGRQPQMPGQAGGYAQPQPGQPYAFQPNQFYAPQPRGEGKAIGALVCGILSIVFCTGLVLGLALGIIAIVLASSYVKQNGPNGKAKAGKICGIIGSILSALTLVVVMLFGCSLLAATSGAALSDSPSNSSSLSGPYDDFSSDSSLGEPEEILLDAATEEAIVDDIVPRLDPWANQTPGGVAEVAQMSDEEFLASTGYLLSDIGIDPEEYAAWQLAGVTYEIAGIHAYDDGSIEVGVDFYNIGGLAFQSAYEWLVEDYIGSGGDRNDTQRLHDLFLEAQDLVYRNEVPGGTGVGYSYAVFYYGQSDGGAWEFDSERWRYEMENLFAPTRDYVMPGILNGE